MSGGGRLLLVERSPVASGRAGEKGDAVRRSSRGPDPNPQRSILLQLSMPKLAVGPVIADSHKIKNAWAANPTFSLGDVKLTGFTATSEALDQLNTTIETKRSELKGLIEQRDDQAKALQELNTRALSGFRAQYGSDSPQYAQAGGTRTSERAAPKRKPKSAAKA